MLTNEEKKIFIDAIKGIEDGLIKIADCQPGTRSDPFDFSAQIYDHGNHIETGLNRIASAIEILAQAISDK